MMEGDEKEMHEIKNIKNEDQDLDEWYKMQKIKMNQETFNLQTISIKESEMLQDVQNTPQLNMVAISAIVREPQQTKQQLQNQQKQLKSLFDNNNNSIKIQNYKQQKQKQNLKDREDDQEESNFLNYKKNYQFDPLKPEGMKHFADTGMELLKMMNPEKEYFPPEYIQKIAKNQLIERIIKDKLDRQINEFNDKERVIQIGQNCIEETLNNFRSLTREKYLKIDHEEIYKKVLKNKIKIPKLFDFKQEEITRGIKFSDLEQLFNQKYQASFKDIDIKKEYQKELRLEISDLLQKIRDLNKQYEDNYKQYNQVGQIDQDLLTAQEQQIKSMNSQRFERTTRRLSLIRTQRQQKDKLEQLLKENVDIPKQKDEIEIQMKAITGKINQIKGELINKQNKLDEVDHDIEKLRQVRTQICQFLKDKLVSIIQKNDLFQYANVAQFKRENLSFVSILRLLQNLQWEIQDDDYPDFLDAQSRKYLSSAAKMEREIETLDIQFKIALQNYKEQTVNNTNSSKSINWFHQDVVKEVKQKMQFITRDQLKIKKPIFIMDNNINNSNQIKWEITEYAKAFGNELQQNQNTIQNQNSQLDQKDLTMNLIIGKTKQLKDLKKNEQNRIYKLNLVPNLTFNQLETLKKIFIALFGVYQGDLDFKIFLQNRKILSKIEEENKTFSFSKNSSLHTKLQQYHIRNQLIGNDKIENQKNKQFDSLTFRNEISESLISRQNLIINQEFNVNNSTSCNTPTDSFKQFFQMNTRHSCRNLFRPSTTKNSDLQEQFQSKYHKQLKKQVSFATEN